MAQNITLLGASYSDVPSVVLPKTGGGTASFDDTTDANATAADIASGKTAYVNGVKLTGTASGGSVVVVDTTDPGGGTIRTITATAVSLQEKTNINPTNSSQTISPDVGYTGLSSVQINAMPSGTAGTPTATKGAVSNHSISVTPSVTNTTGYITGSTKTGTAVTVSASELVSGSETKTANGTYDVTNLASVVVNVSGGSSKAFQIDNSNHRIQTTTYTDTGAYLKVAKAGKYDIYWSAFRSSTSTGTNGTQWYKNDVAQGSAYTTWSNSYCQNPHVTGVTLAKDDEIKIYARASSNSRYCCVENLMIIEVD